MAVVQRLTRFVHSLSVQTGIKSTQKLFHRSARFKTTPDTGCRCFTSAGVQDVVIVSAARTPIGSFGGGLKRMSVTDLGACAIREVVERSGIEKTAFEDCYMGVVLAAGVGQTPARQALLKAGLPETVESTTVNKACASGMKAVMIGAQTVMLGHQNIVVVGGMESMSRTPFILERKSIEWNEQKLYDSLYCDGFLDPGLGILMGNCAENTNKKLGITREAQDEYCIQSYTKSAAAWRTGVMDAEVFPVEVKTKHCKFIFVYALKKNQNYSNTVTEDEEYTNLILDKVPLLKPAFQKDGSVTAANASKMNDGASALVITSQQEAQRLNIKPLAKIVSFADAATHPIDFPVAPALAVNKLLKQSGVNKDDVTMWEINEAFSGVVIANIRVLDLDPSKVNIHGGAVSLGHPVGSSGARITSHLAHNLKTGEKGVATICNGGGAASAILIEGL